MPRGARYVSRKRLCIGGLGAPHLCAAGGLRECLAPWWLTCLASVSVQNRVQLPVGQAFRLLDARVREVRHYCSGASKGQGSSGPGGALQCRPIWTLGAQASARARIASEFDFIIDDGGHTNPQVWSSFEYLFDTKP